MPNPVYTLRSQDRAFTKQVKHNNDRAVAAQPTPPGAKRPGLGAVPTSHPALRPFAPAERLDSRTPLRAHSGTQLLLAGHSGENGRREIH